MGDRPILAPALGAVAFWAIWMGEFDEGERALRRAWEVAEPRIDPAAAVLLHMVTGQSHAARGQHQAALEGFAAGARAQSLLTGVHAFATPVVGWLAATQARLGMADEARETLAGFSAEPGPIGFIHNARAVICMAEGDPAGALDVLRDVPDATPPTGPAFTLVETHLLAGLAHLELGDRHAAAAAAEAALAGRRARPADLPVRHDRGRGPGRRCSRATKRLTGHCSPTSPNYCEANQSRASIRSAYRNRRSSPRASSACSATCRQT